MSTKRRSNEVGVLAFALAFGLGGQRWAGALLERWWPARRKEDRDEQP